MTEAELLEVAANYWSNVISLITIFITAMSGYLVVAYIVGKELNTQQATLVNTLYGALQGFALFSIFEFARAGVENGKLALEMSTQRTVGPSESIPFVFIAIMFPMILASYKFMWDIRHPKAE